MRWLDTQRKSESLLIRNGILVGAGLDLLSETSKVLTRHLELLILWSHSCDPHRTRGRVLMLL